MFLADVFLAGTMLSSQEMDQTLTLQGPALPLVSNCAGQSVC